MNSKLGGLFGGRLFCEAMCMKYGFVLYIMFVCFLSPLLMAQEEFGAGEARVEASWKVIQVPLVDEEISGPLIAQLMREGYYPVGLEIVGTDMLAILGEKREFSLVSYRLKYFPSLETVKTDFAAFLKDGWLPTGTAFFDDGLLVLFVESDARLRAWKMQAVEGTDLLARQQSVHGLFRTALKDGLTPFGLARYGEQLMIGFVTATNEERFDQYILAEYPNDGVSFVAGINRWLREGYSLSGFQFFSDTIYIGFVK